MVTRLNFKLKSLRLISENAKIYSVAMFTTDHAFIADHAFY